MGPIADPINALSDLADVVNALILYIPFQPNKTPFPLL